MSIDMIWSESDVDLVVLVFFSAGLLLFFFFLFLGSESSTCFLDLRVLRDLSCPCSFPWSSSAFCWFSGLCPKLLCASWRPPRLSLEP